MNETPNPPDANPPPSDSTPPPPPPPPFTPPPSSPEPPPPPAAATPPMPSAPASPQQPIYVPSAAPPAKKSSTPWILGGCGCLALLAIFAAIIAYFVYGVTKKLPELVARSWSTYTNVKENVPAALQPYFVGFYFHYPKSFIVQTAGKSNFVKVEKYAWADNTTESFAVGWASFSPPEVQSDALYDTLLDKLGKDFANELHNYKELRRTAETVDGVKSRGMLFQGGFNDSSNTIIWAKAIVVHPPGKKNGVTILLLGTSRSRDIKGADDLGVKGESAEILRSFRFQ